MIDFSSVSALVCGDPIKDHYIFGHISKMSAEAPIGVFVADHSEVRPGGALNVIENMRQLGCHVTQYTSPVPSFKHRYMVGQYQVFRHDEDVIYESFRSHSVPSLTGINVIVLSDYAKGFLTPQFCQEIISEAQTKGIPVIVDPKGQDWSKYAGCSLICPNLKEFIENTCKTPFNNILLKKGSDGMTLYRGLRVMDIPAAAKHVFDVSGAGDTVVATMAACLGSGVVGLEEAAHIASKAAGYVVSEVGTTAISAQKLKELI